MRGLFDSQSDLFKRPRPAQANAVRVAVAAAPPARGAAYWDAYHAACAELGSPAPRGPGVCAVCAGSLGQMTPSVPVAGAWLHAEPCWRTWWAERCAKAHAIARSATEGLAA